MQCRLSWYVAEETSMCSAPTRYDSNPPVALRPFVIPSLPSVCLVLLGHWWVTAGVLRGPWHGAFFVPQAVKVNMLDNTCLFPFIRFIWWYTSLI
jgi:hypothetical protein